MIENSLEALIQTAAGTGPSFPANSRYAETGTLTLIDEAGREVPYLKRRFIPAADELAAFAEHTVHDDDRLDNVASKHLSDPEQFWRIADANNAMNPFELTNEAGRVLRVSLPEGFPSSDDSI